MPGWSASPRARIHFGEAAAAVMPIDRLGQRRRRHASFDRAGGEEAEDES